MRRNHLTCWTVWLLCAGLLGLGCGDDSGSAGSGGSAGTGGTGGSDATVSVDVQVVRFQPGEEDVPLEGAEVCLEGTENCATSDEEGLVQLDVPASSELTLELAAEGFGPTLLPVTTTDTGPAPQLGPLLDDATLELLAGVLGIDYPFVGTGVMAVSVLEELTVPVVSDDPGIPGITLTADREGSIYYLDENEFPQFDLSATTAPSGAGGLVEAEPDTWELTLGGTASNCVIVTGWPGSTESAFRFPIRAGFVTQTVVTCDPVE